MRISTPMMYDEGIKNIQDRQEQMNRLQTQLSSEKRILTPSDDPVGSASSLSLQQTQSANTQYGKNSQTASDALSLMESSIQSAVETLQNIKSVAVQGGNATLNGQDREAIAQQIDQAFQQMMGVANTANADGDYIFSGYSTNVKPFVETASGQVTYFGDQGQRSAQVSPSLQLPISKSGFNVFQQVPAGNGVFVTSTTPTNTGSGAIDAGNVTDASLLTGNDYAITFNVTSTETTYSVVNTTTNATVLSSQLYQPNTAIQFDGVAVTIQGSPANGDQFAVQPASNQSVFTTLDQLRQALRSPQDNPQMTAVFHNNFNSALAGLDQALNHVVDVQASIGAFMSQADANKSRADDLNVQYSNQLSQLQDLDPYQAISDFNKQQVFLQTAQKTFMQIQGLSLFNFIN